MKGKRIILTQRDIEKKKEYRGNPRRNFPPFVESGDWWKEKGGRRKRRRFGRRKRLFPSLSRASIQSEKIMPSTALAQYREKGGGGSWASFPPLSPRQPPPPPPPPQQQLPPPPFSPPQRCPSRVRISLPFQGRLLVCADNRLEILRSRAQFLLSPPLADPLRHLGRIVV